MVQFICDPGQNYHNLEDLKTLATECASAGADFFKPQIFSTDSLYTKNNPYYSWIKSHELSLQDAEDIFCHCSDVGIECIFSPFDLSRLDWCNELGVFTIKVAARMASDIDFLQKAADYKFKAIISLSNEHKHFSTFEYQSLFGEDNVRFLHCVSQYPAPIELYSLKTAEVLQGISDHTTDTILSFASVARGVNLIERHVYYRPILESPDMICSLSTNGLKYTIDNCKLIEKIR